jgi:hypothetical protein
MTGMFRVTCFVKDTKLAEFLRHITGKAYNVNAIPAAGMDGEAIAPVRSKAVRKPRKATRKTKTAVPPMEQAIGVMPMRFRTQALKDRLGLSQTPVNRLIRQALNAGLIERVSVGQYRRVQKGETLNA